MSVEITPSPVHRALALAAVVLPLALLAGSCRPESASRSKSAPLFSKESFARTAVFVECEEALKERCGERLLLPAAASDYHIQELSPDRFELRSVVDLLDAEGDRRLRSRFRCAVELSGDRSDFFREASSMVLTIDALDSPRRHALWPWPRFGRVRRAGRSGPAK